MKQHSTKRAYFPSLRGFFGEWTYYVSIIPMQEVAERVSFAEEIHKSEKLSQMIQRQLKGGRAKEIAEYLENEKERFFNALVVAVYRGDPAWHEFGSITPVSGSKLSYDDLPDESRHSVGYLSLSGKERLFALDGQHRLAGIREVCKRASQSGVAIDDDVAVVFVAHTESKKGRERTRRLFTVLNKTARPVSPGEIIALDEDDVAAICCRRLVEEYKAFSGEKISFRAQPNLPQGELQALTTIRGLYDVLGVLFTKVTHTNSLRDLRKRRPSDSTLEEYYEAACNYFDLLGKAFPELGKFLRAQSTKRIVQGQRNDNGGHVLFRPVGLRIITEVIAQLRSSDELETAIKKAARLPSRLDELPYAGLLWEPTSNTMAPARRPLVRDLLLYMLGRRSDVKALGRRYESALAAPGEGSKLIGALNQIED